MEALTWNELVEVQCHRRLIIHTAKAASGSLEMNGHVCIHDVTLSNGCLGDGTFLSVFPAGLPQSIQASPGDLNLNAKDRWIGKNSVDFLLLGSQWLAVGLGRG